MKLKIFLGLVALFAAFSSSVRAEITAQEVLDEWREVSSTMGQQLVIGSEEMVGDTLVLSDFASTIALPEVTISVTSDWVKMQEAGGSVKITMAPTTVLHVNAEPSDGPKIEVTGQSEQTGLIVLVSGSPEEMTFNFAADSYDFSLQKVSVQQLLLDAALNLNLTDLTGEYALTRNDQGTRHIEGRYDLGDFAMEVDFKIPGGSDFITGTISAVDMGVEILADIIGVEEIEALVALGKNPLQGINIAYEGGGKAAKMDFSGLIDGAHGRLKYSQEEFSGGLEISPEIVAYGFSYIGGVINVASSELPFPEVEVKFDEIALDLEIPLSQSDEPGDVSMLIALRDVEVSDFLWGIFDPGKTLPRDPASAVIDVTGKINILVDIMNLAEVAGIKAPPVEAISLDLNELLVSFAGASLEGDGAFTFDNNDLQTYDGIPRPIGKVNLSLRGGFGLLDKLVDLGLVPSDASFGIRAMLGAFSTPGDEPDHFISVVEMTPEGGITANGQRIK